MFYNKGWKHPPKSKGYHDNNQGYYCCNDIGFAIGNDSKLIIQSGLQTTIHKLFEFAMGTHH